MSGNAALLVPLLLREGHPYGSATLALIMLLQPIGKATSVEHAMSKISGAAIICDGLV